MSLTIKDPKKMKPERTDLPDPEMVKKELLAKYPVKVARKRSKQIMANSIDECGNTPVMGANVRTVPGIITQRGCCYAGCKGVIMGPTRDIINITPRANWMWILQLADPDATRPGPPRIRMTIT